jgi:hypothetical protein
MNIIAGVVASRTRIVSTVFIVSWLLLIAGCRSRTPERAAQPPVTSSPSQPSSSDVQKQRQEAERQLRPEVEAQRQQEQREAEQTIDQDAIAAVDQTVQAIKAIAANKKEDALSAIERATGKINILLARNPSSALIVVDAEVVVIDTAPLDLKVIDQKVQLTTTAVKEKDLPVARVILATLVSEIRIEIVSLPLATYPAALSQAARLLDQGKTQEAGTVLLTALNTLVIVDHVVPVPLILSQAAISAADKQQQDKEAAMALLEVARNELNRSRELGYLSGDPEYRALEKQISDLESTIKGKGNIGSKFSELRDRLSALLKRQKDKERR